MALVGILALGSAIGSGVMERTREIGILRSVGASAALVGRMVMTEGLLYGALSWLAALTLAVPITVFLDRFVGTQAFLVPLPFVLPADVVAISGAVALAGAAAASLAGAWTASRVTVRAALATA